MNKAVIAALFGAVILTGCEKPADVASRNLSNAADRFEISRRIIFYNGRSDTYMLTIEGLCALGNQDKNREVTVTCKTGPESFKKHFLGLSESITYFVEQTEQTKVDTYHYRVEFRPQTIIPSIGLDTK